MDARLTPPLEEIDHVRGEAGAPLQLVMFGDFQCPFCLRAHAIVWQVEARLGDRLVFAFRHLPVSERHPLAPLAAQGKFWEYWDALFAVQPKLSRETMLAVGGELELDVERMAAEIDAGAHTARIQRDLDSAAASGATGTPSFFANGEHFFGRYSADVLVAALEG